jgi:hypothetical protein
MTVHNEKEHIFDELKYALGPGAIHKHETLAEDIVKNKALVASCDSLIK